MKKTMIIGIMCLLAISVISAPLVAAKFSYSPWFLSFLKSKGIVVNSGNKAPVAAIKATPRKGETPLLVRFYSTGSYDPDGRIVKYYWDFGDGKHSILRNPWHTYRKDGIYKVKLTVTDNKGKKTTRGTTVISNLGPYPPEQLKCNIPYGTGVGGKEYTCQCIAGDDPFGSKVMVEFAWGDGTSSFSGWVQGGTLVQMNHTWPVNKPWEQVVNYNLGVRDWDKANATSIWTNMTISMPKAKGVTPKKTNSNPIKRTNTGLTFFGRKLLPF
ncbi:MAG: PKD domain-containing protein [Candidatus Diapherotrites archaeon]|nr:PKD domain-containing protein [Candidatus Diapherotrites archaeon]